MDATATSVLRVGIGSKLSHLSVVGGAAKRSCDGNCCFGGSIGSWNGGDGGSGWGGTICCENDAGITKTIKKIIAKYSLFNGR